MLSHNPIVFVHCFLSFASTRIHGKDYHCRGCMDRDAPHYLADPDAPSVRNIHVRSRVSVADNTTIAEDAGSTRTGRRGQNRTYGGGANATTYTPTKDRGGPRTVQRVDNPRRRGSPTSPLLESGTFLSFLIPTKFVPLHLDPEFTTLNRQNNSP